MWYVRDVLYAVLYVRVSCFVVRGCGVSRRYIYVYIGDVLVRGVGGVGDMCMCLARAVWVERGMSG